MSYMEKNAWDRAVSAELRRSKRLGFLYQQPTRYDRNETYGRNEVIRLSNVKGIFAKYRLTPTLRVRRINNEQ